MNDAPEKFLTRAALAKQKDRRPSKPRDLDHLSEHAAPSRARADQLLSHRIRLHERVHGMPPLQPRLDPADHIGGGGWGKNVRHSST